MRKPQTPLLAIHISHYGQKSQPQHLKLCHLIPISVAGAMNGSDRTKFP